MASQKLILLLVVITAATGLPVGTSSASDAFEQVCDTALDRAFCFNNFGSDPWIKDETLPQLALSTIIRIEIRGTLAESKIQTLIQSTIDPRFKYILQKCDTFYKGVLGALTSGPDDVNNKNYRHLGYLAKIASDGGTRCEELFGVPVPYNYPLWAENRDLKNVGDILRVISGLLSSGTGRGEIEKERGA